MNFQAKTTHFLNHKTGCLVIPVHESTKLSGHAAELDKASKGLISDLLKRGDIKTDIGATQTLLQPAGCDAERLVLVGAGKSKEAMSPEQFDKIIHRAASAIKSCHSKNAALIIDELAVKDRDDHWKARQSAKILSNSTYLFEQLKSNKKSPFPLKQVTLLTTDKGKLSAFNKALGEGAAIAAGMSMSKDLGNLPGNICTPRYLASEARKLARKQQKLTTKVLSEKQMRELGMGSLLSVSNGSEEEAQLIVMDYKGGKKTDKPVVLVGKGITFDTGGISLKPGAAMDEMKYDMCGAASVFGVITAVMEMELPINLIGVVAAAENMPSGRATKPGDIVTSMSGQTIEVLNTDAEGRLVLCDALTYVERFKPKAVIDIATLTGACVVALGKHTTGLFSNSDQLAERLLRAGTMAADKAWQLPMSEEYEQQLQSNFADMANIGGPTAGCITAACFLSKFTKSYDWAHLDIAGTAWVSGKDKGATGRPVPLLVEYLQQL